MARYTHDLSRRPRRAGSSSTPPSPNIATTLTDVPGPGRRRPAHHHDQPPDAERVLVPVLGQRDHVRVRRQREEHARRSTGSRSRSSSRRTASGLIPTVAITGPLAAIGRQPALRQHVPELHVRRQPLLPGAATTRSRAASCSPSSRRTSCRTSATQGSFSFAAGGGRTAFQNFLTGNADGLCGATCTYTEPEFEVDSQFRWQPLRVLRAGLVEGPARTSPSTSACATSSTPASRTRTTSSRTSCPRSSTPPPRPRWSSAGRRRRWSWAAATSRTASSSPGQNSPYGRRHLRHRQGQRPAPPRLLVGPRSDDGQTVVRGGFGIYYDQPLIGIFLQNAFVNPPFVTNPSVLNPLLSNPGAGPDPDRRCRRWRSSRLERRRSRCPGPCSGTSACSASSTAGRRSTSATSARAGDNLIQPVDINARAARGRRGHERRRQPRPARTRATPASTCGRRRLHELPRGWPWASATTPGRAGTLSIAYTLSQAKTTRHQRPRRRRPAAGPRPTSTPSTPSPRNDRTHVFTANWVYELPFFKDSPSALREGDRAGLAGLGHRRRSGPAPPISRVVNGNTNGSRRGIRVNAGRRPVREPPGERPGLRLLLQPGGVRAAGGRAVRQHGPRDLPAAGRQPVGHHARRRTGTCRRSVRLQFRADFINAFNHTQLDPARIQNTCSDRHELRRRGQAASADHRHARAARDPAGPAPDVELG